MQEWVINPGTESRLADQLVSLENTLVPLIAVTFSVVMARSRGVARVYSRPGAGRYGTSYTCYFCGCASCLSCPLIAIAVNVVTTVTVAIVMVVVFAEVPAVRSGCRGDCRGPHGADAATVSAKVRGHHTKNRLFLCGLI